MTNRYLSRLADRVLNRPLLISPGKAAVILDVLAGRIGIDNSELNRFTGTDIARDENGRPVARRPYRVERGVAIVPVIGSLLSRGMDLDAESGLMSYEGISHKLRSAAQDPEVESIILDIASPGGEAGGALEMGELVRKISARKRTVALVNNDAASAAYAIASGASEIVTTPTGVSGSIGVVTVHADQSERLAQEGIKPTLIYAGAHKVDGHPFGPLSDSVRADLQERTDSLYLAFTEQVARGRGSRLTATKARRTEAREYRGQDAVDAGLADRIGDFDSVLNELSRRSGTRRRKRSGKMDEDETVGHTAEELAEARRAGESAGATRERERLSAIMAETKGEPAQMAAALDLAMRSPGMSAEDVVGFITANVVPAAAKAEEPAAALSKRHEVPDSLGALHQAPAATRRPLVDGMKAELAKRGVR